MHAVTMNEKRDHEFEGKWREICGRLWKEERVGRNVVTEL